MLKNLIKYPERIVNNWQGLNTGEESLKFLTREFNKALALFLNKKALEAKYQEIIFGVTEEILSNFARYSCCLENNTYENSLTIYNDRNSVVLQAENSDFSNLNYIVYNNKLVLKVINTPKFKSGIYYKVLKSYTELFKEGEILNHVQIYSMSEGLAYRPEGFWLLDGREDYASFQDFNDQRNIFAQNIKRGGMGLVIINKNIISLAEEITKDFGYLINQNMFVRRYAENPPKVQLIIELVKRS